MLLENGVYFVANQKTSQFLRKPLMRNYLNEGNEQRVKKMLWN